MNYYKFEDLDIGMSFEFKEVITEEKMALFLKLSGDNNTLHCDEEYANQVTAEHKIAVKRGGKEIRVWTPKTSHADNHYLDAEVYAFCAADLLDVRLLFLQSKQSAEVVQKEEIVSKKERLESKNWFDKGGW